MPITADILQRKATHFVLWCPAPPTRSPQLVIGQFEPGNPPTLHGERRLALQPAANVHGLWELAAAQAGLRDGHVYHYWFEVADTHPAREAGRAVRCTDPTALTVDWRLLSPPLPAPYTGDDQEPAAVVKFVNGQLVPCDPGGEEPDLSGGPSPDTLPANNQIVIYELPTAWSRGQDMVERGVGTFEDARALVDAGVGGANFGDLAVTRPGRAYLKELGVNALELLPPADSAYYREWGYGTSHFFAPDHELGFPEGHSWPTANRDLAALVRACHANGIRVFMDVVMAFAKTEAYQHIDFSDFCIANPGATPADPDAYQSRIADGARPLRNGYGSTLFRYAKFVQTYDPMDGHHRSLSPARQLMLAYLTRWMRDFHVDGVRMDSVENVANWDFVKAFTDFGRRLWRQRWADAGVPADGGAADARFLVIGEELWMPLELVRQSRLDALWNDAFRDCIRAAILGESARGEPSFEWTVRKAIDCRILGFRDGAEAVNYLTSHDVEGERRERLFNMFRSAKVADLEKRIELAFVCLLTAVGIPMILAGEEFADQHDRFDENGHVNQDGGKQVDPVNFTRLQDPMRLRIFEYVARLVHLRTTHPALAVNETDFIHVDFTDGKRVLVWRRGPQEDPIVVVANFSDWGTDVSRPNAEYRVPNWPDASENRQWKDVSQDRLIPPEWVAREPVYPWEAKVYALV